MFDVSDRFLHQLAADRRESLLRSGRASTHRPLLPALRAGLARLGLGSGGAPGSAGQSLGRTRPAFTSTEEKGCIREGSTESMQHIGKPAARDVVVPIERTSTARLGRGARQA